MNADGTLARGSGVSSAGKNQGDGSYTVVFETDVSACAWTGNVGGPSSGAFDGGIFNVSGTSDGPQAVDVLTHGLANPLAPANRAFHLAVFCRSESPPQ